MARDFPHRVVVGDEDVGNLFPRDGFMREFRVRIENNMYHSRKLLRL